MSAAAATTSKNAKPWTTMPSGSLGRGSRKTTIPPLIAVTPVLAEEADVRGEGAEEREEYPSVYVHSQWLSPVWPVP